MVCYGQETENMKSFFSTSWHPLICTNHLNNLVLQTSIGIWCDSDTKCLPSASLSTAFSHVQLSHDPDGVISLHPNSQAHFRPCLLTVRVSRLLCREPSCVIWHEKLLFLAKVSFEQVYHNRRYCLRLTLHLLSFSHSGHPENTRSKTNRTKSSAERAKFNLLMRNTLDAVSFAS